VLEGVVISALCEHRARAHGFCWMTNHIHLVVEISDDRVDHFLTDLSKRYAAGLDGEAAALFELPGHSVRVLADPYLLELIRYVHLNPVRSGVVVDPADYPWSSHRSYLGLPGAPWVCTDLVFRLLGGDLLRALAAYRGLIVADECRLPAPARQSQSPAPRNRRSRVPE
jgi:REP element-mobilizing transposase RayT